MTMKEVNKPTTYKKTYKHVVLGENEINRTKIKFDLTSPQSGSILDEEYSYLGI